MSFIDWEIFDYEKNNIYYIEYVGENIATVTVVRFDEKKTVTSNTERVIKICKFYVYKSRQNFKMTGQRVG